jgi:hypothetical protein
MQEGKLITYLVVESEPESVWLLFLLPELSAMVHKPSLAKQLNPLRLLNDFLPLHRSPSSSLLLEIEVEVRETGVEVARSNHHSGLASALLLPQSSLILVLALVLVLVVAP